MRHRILIVDDEPYILRILSFKLRRAGYSTLEAVSAEEARALLAEHPVDLMLLDVALATATNGFEFAESLREEQRTAPLPIVMLTARGQELDKVLGLEMGADDYVVKPFSPKEVVARVKAILRRVPPSGPLKMNSGLWYSPCPGSTAHSSKPVGQCRGPVPRCHLPTIPVA